MMVGAVMFSSVGCYRRFATLTPAQAQEAADFASARSQEYPLWQRDAKGEFPTYEVPHFGKRSSVYLIALMSAYLVWMQKQAGVALVAPTPLLRAALDGYALYERGHS
jgi:hypothetical protein